MSLSDPIADMLTRIRNAQQAKHELCVIPGSKIKKSILDLLKEEGFVDDVQTVKNGSFDDFQVKLKYDTEKTSDSYDRKSVHSRSSSLHPIW